MKRVVSSIMAVALCACSADPGYAPRYEPQESSPATLEAQPSPQPQSTAVEAPRKTIVALQVCADRFAPRLSKTADSYAVKYDINLDGNGSIVKVNDSMIPGTELEACLTNVLKHMEIPDSVSSTSQVSPQSRSVVGVVQAAAAPIALLPIVLVAGGVTILVGITIYTAVELIKRWPTDDNDEDCTARYDQCIDRVGGGQRGNHWHESRCGTCRAVCQKEKSWPAFIPLFGKGLVPCP